MAYFPPPIISAAFLQSDFTNNTTSNLDSPLGFAAEANKTYVVKIAGVCNKITTATGLTMQVTAPTGSTVTGWMYRGVTAASTAMQQTELTAINTLTGTFSNAANTRFAFRVEYTITIGSTAGNVLLGMATLTSNTATIFAGASILWHEAISL